MASKVADLPQGRLRTQFVRFARMDWAALTMGEKREYRVAGRFAPPPGSLDPPIPIVGYTFSAYRDEADSALFLVEGAHREPLGAISAASLEREGFEDLTEFRAYWKERHPNAGYRPLSVVWALELRPFTAEDVEPTAARMLERLYGNWLPE